MRLLLLLLFLTSTSLFSQVSEIVNETWNLRYLRVDNVNHLVPNGETFILDINEDAGQYTFQTNGIENTFFGELTFDTANEMLEFTDIGVTLVLCTMNNCDYEDLYFYEILTDEFFTLKSFEYQYFEFTSGKKLLRLTDELGNIATYADQPLDDPDPALFRTWYLHSMDADLGETTYISDYDPPIHPTLTISEDLSFTGFGSCNEFSGNFIYTEDFQGGFKLLPTNYDETMDACQFHNDFEEWYFYQFSSMELLYYSVWETTGSGQAGFSFDLFPGFTFHFFNYPVLSVPEFQTVEASISPNPVADVLQYTSSLEIEHIGLISFDGKVLRDFDKNETIPERLDVSFLSTGIYFIVFEAENGRAVKKFVKE